MDSLQKVFLYLLIFLNIAVPITTILVSRKLSKNQLPQIYTVYPPGGGGDDDDDDDTPTSPNPSVNASVSPNPSVSPSPSSSPSGITIKANFQGLPANSQNISFTLVTSNNSWSKAVIMNADGTFANFDFSGLDMTESYDFVLYAHPYLTSKKTINLATGAQTIDFGTIRTGDLDGNNQVNTLDWSFMKLNFGVDGD